MSLQHISKLMYGFKKYPGFRCRLNDHLFVQNAQYNQKCIIVLKQILQPEPLMHDKMSEYTENGDCSLVED